jgi:DNA-binding Lrp family transcriptional regulator
MERLDQLDRRIIAALQVNPRATWRQIAAAVGSTESTVKRRAERLIETGAIRITAFTDNSAPGFPVLVQFTCGFSTRAGVRVVTIVDPHLLGYDAQLLLWLRVDLAQREQVATALAARREVRYLSATSGYSDLVCEVILRSQSEVYDFSSQVLGTLPGIHQVNMAAELLAVKRAYLRMEAL